MQVFLIINSVGMKTNAGVNEENRLTKKNGIKDLFGIVVIVNMNVINHVVLENIQTIQIARVKKGQLVNQLKNAQKILMRLKQQK